MLDSLCRIFLCFVFVYFRATPGIAQGLLLAVLLVLLSRTHGFLESNQIISMKANILPRHYYFSPIFVHSFTHTQSHSIIITTTTTTTTISFQTFQAKENGNNMTLSSFMSVFCQPGMLDGC